MGSASSPYLCNSSKCRRPLLIVLLHVLHGVGTPGRLRFGGIGTEAINDGDGLLTLAALGLRVAVLVEALRRMDPNVFLYLFAFTSPSSRAPLLVFLCAVLLLMGFCLLFVGSSASSPPTPASGSRDCIMSGSGDVSSSL